MLKRLIKWRLTAFEKHYDYDLGYARQLLEADTGAFLAFAKVQGMSRYRQGVPLEPWYAAKMVGSMHEDCGPCTQLVVRMAEEAGVAASTIAAVIADDRAALPEAVQLAVDFARAALNHDLAADGLRDEVVRRWGQRGLASLAFALTAARIYPTMKYALGHGHACTRVVVGGKALVPAAAS